MATWKDAFQESTNRRNSDFRVPVTASLKEKINRYYESTSDDITDWVQSTIDSWVSYYDDTHEDYLRAVEELETASDWFSNNLYEFEDKYGYSPDEDLVCEIAQDYASSTLEYLKDTRERFEDDEEYEEDEESEEYEESVRKAKLTENSKDPYKLAKKYNLAVFELRGIDVSNDPARTTYIAIAPDHRVSGSWTICLTDTEEIKAYQKYHQNGNWLVAVHKPFQYYEDACDWLEQNIDRNDTLEGDPVLSESKLKEKKVQAEGLDDNVKDWYMANHHYFREGYRLNPDLTFRDLFIAIGEGKEDIDKILDNEDRYIREVIFVELAKRLKVDYDVVYGLWMGNIHTRESKKTGKKRLREGGDIGFIFDEKAFKSSGIYDKLAEVYSSKIAGIFLDWVKSPEYKDGPFVISYEWGPESAMITSPDLMNFDFASKYAELFADLRGRKGIYFHDSSPFGSLLSDKFMQRELTAIKSSKDDVKFIGDGMVLNHLNGDALDESKKTKAKRLREDQESPEILEEMPTENEELEVKEDSFGDALSQEEIEDINYRISHVRSEYFSLELDQDTTDPGIILESLQAFRNEFSDTSTTLVTVKYSEFIADALDPKTPEGYLRYLCKRLYQDLVDKLLTWAEDTWGHFATGKFKNYGLLDLARFWDTVASVHNDLGELLVNLLGTYQNEE